jgi:hypothetical protein
MNERLNLLRVLSLIALMSSTLTAATLLPVTAQTDSLVGYWSFNEGTGPTAFDGSTFGNDGTLVGPTWTTGKVDGALQFNGGSPGDHVVIPYDSSLSLDTNRVTFAFWVYPTDLTHDYNTIIQKDTADNLWFDWVISPRAADVAYLPTCVIDLNADKVSQPTERASGDFILSANVWYFIACTFDGTDIKFYIDGTERGTTPTGGGSIPDSGTEIWIGATDVWPNEPHLQLCLDPGGDPDLDECHRRHFELLHGFTHWR